MPGSVPWNASVSSQSQSQPHNNLPTKPSFKAVGTRTMGLGSYLKSTPTAEPASPTQRRQMSETQVPAYLSQDPSLTMGGSRYNTALASSRSSLAPSVRSVQSTFLDDIKHEVMVNYLYQQQCSRLWVSDGNGECEGVLLRRSRGQYLACPPQLVISVFGQVCAELNVPVSQYWYLNLRQH